MQKSSKEKCTLYYFWEQEKMNAKNLKKINETNKSVKINPRRLINVLSTLNHFFKNRFPKNRNEERK